MIDIYFKSIKDLSFHKIHEHQVGAWLHVDGAAQEDLIALSDLTAIALEDLTDSLDKYETPRIEEKDGNLIIFTRHPIVEDEGLHTTTLTIIVTNSYFITICPGTSKLIEGILASKVSFSTSEKSKLLLHLLVKINHDFNVQIKNVRHAVIEQEKKIKNIDNSTIFSLTKNEEKFNQYLDCLVPMKFILQSLNIGKRISLDESDKNVLENQLIALNQSEDLCRINVKSIRSLRDAYQILFTNDVNKTIKLLTAITIIIEIPTIISSLYGMNIALPIAKSPHAFAIIGILILVSIILAVWLFYRKKWL